MPMRQGTTWRSAFAEPVGVRRAPAPRRDEVTCEIPTARSRAGGAAIDQGLDDRRDGIAMRDEPCGDCVNRGGDERRADDRREQAEEDRAAEGVVELLDRPAGEAAVEHFHRRNGDRARGDRAAEERDALADVREPLREARSIGRGQLEAVAQPARGESAGEHERDAAEQLARRVRYVVVRVVRKREVADDIDGEMRDRCGGGCRAESENDERTKAEAHASARRPASGRNSPQPLATCRRRG